MSPLNKHRVLAEVRNIIATAPSITSILTSYGTVDQTLFTTQAPEGQVLPCLIIANRSVEDLEFIQQNNLAIQTQWIDIEYMVSDYIQPGTWSILDNIIDVLHKAKVTSVTGYLIDIIYSYALPSLYTEVNSVRFTIEGYRFQVLIRPVEY